MEMSLGNSGDMISVYNLLSTHDLTHIQSYSSKGVKVQQFYRISHLLPVSNSCLIQKHSTEDMEDIFIEYFIT